MHLEKFKEYLNKNEKNMGSNHVYETTRHGIVAHGLWEENLGNVTEVIVTDSFVFVARSLRFCCPKSSVLLPKLYPKRENSNPKLFFTEIAFGQ